MSSVREADVEKEEHTRVKRPRSRCREWKYTRTQTTWRQMKTRGQTRFIYGRIDY